MIPVRGRLGHRNGIAVRESPGTVQVLVKGDVPVDMPTAQFDAAPAVDVPGPEVIGAAGRLWKAIGAQASGRLRAKWQPEVIHAAALVHAQAGPGARRAAALDALALGAPQAVDAVGLAETEACWYRARTAVLAGDTAAAVAWLERLPRQGYAPRVALLALRVNDLLQDAVLAARAAALLEPFAATDLDARALRAALSDPGAVDAVEPLVAFAVAAEDQDGQLAAWASAIAGLEPPARPFPDSVPSARALEAYLHGRAGARCEVGVDILGRLPVPLLDELIEAGAIPPELANQPGWPQSDASYLRCRLNPREAAEADLRESGFTAELARRGYLAFDAAALADLPSDDPAVRHYRALAAWRLSGGEPDLDAVRPGARRILSQLATVRAATRAGEEATVPEELAADPTCWPLLWEAALRGSLRLPTHLADRHPRFADWLDLCGLQRYVFASSWPEVIARGRDLASRTALEVTSDEALNMVAFAEFQQGRPAVALQVLADALAGRYTTGLLVNASVVAAAGGSEAAMPFLAQIARSESAPAVRSGAVRRAVDLWMQDADSPEYPAVLRELVREALAVPQPDELHRTLLLLADTHDAAWLAAPDSPVHADGQDQASALRYRRTWARAKTDGYPEGLASVAETLVELAKAPSPAGWVRTELSSFSDSINEAVHVDFGEALHLAPTIEVLVSSGLLNLPQTLVLAAQAGAHIAVHLAENGKSIAPEVESRLLFATVRVFLERRSELSEGARELVGGEIAKCVSVAGRAMGLVASREFDSHMEQWNELVRRERIDTQNRYLILRMQREVLEDLDSYLIRLRTYLNHMSGLPLSDAHRELQSTLSGALGDFSAEVSRLRRFL